MSFLWPFMLRFLAVIPLFVLLYLRMQQHRRELAARYGSLGLAASPAGRPGLRRHLPPVLFLVSLTVLMLALARPQTVVSLPRIEGTVILAFDVSGSMAADDLEPTRMEAAKAAARGFVEKQPISVLIGVVAFSDSGFSVQAPTNDQAAIEAAIDRLVPARGTSLGNGILASLQAIATSQSEAAGLAPPRLYTSLTPAPLPSPVPLPPGEHSSAAILLLTDGENNVRPDPLGAARLAADRGIRIYTIGIGSTAGTTIHVEGFTVHTQLDEPLLQQIAQLTDGAYYSAASEEDLRLIYENVRPELVIKPETTEVTSIFAGAGILLLLFGGAFSLAWFSRVP